MKKILVFILVLFFAAGAGAAVWPSGRTGRIGHRGARGLLDENTLESLKLAEGLGVDMLEFDVQRTKDGVLVIMHDETVDRTTTGTGRIDQMTLAEFKSLKTKPGGYTPPTLDEVLSWLSTVNVQFILDFKIPDSETAKQLVAAVEAHGLLDRAIFESPVPAVAGMIEKMRPDLETALYPADMWRMRSYLKKYNIDDASYYYPFANPLEIRLAKKMGKRVMVWTVDSKGLINWFTSLNVDGIMTDDPNLFPQKKK